MGRAASGNHDPVPRTLAPDDVRAVLAAAADVVFTDGVPREFLDQWAEETCFLLRAAEDSEAAVRRGPGGSDIDPR